MNTTYTRVTAAAALLLLASSCSDTTAVPARPTAASMRSVTSLRPDGVTPPDFSAMSAEQREAYFSGPSAAADAIHDAVLMESWDDADRSVRAVLRSNPAVPAYFLEAVAGTVMLERAVGARGASEAPAEDLLFYAGLLARNLTPEADLTARALDAAVEKDAGARDDVRTVATRAVASGETFAARPESAQQGPAFVQEAARRGTPLAGDERRGAAMRRLRELAAG